TGRTHDCKRLLCGTLHFLLPGGGHPHMAQSVDPTQPREACRFIGTSIPLEVRITIEWSAWSTLFKLHFSLVLYGTSRRAQCGPCGPYGPTELRIDKRCLRTCLKIRSNKRLRYQPTEYHLIY